MKVTWLGQSGFLFESTNGASDRSERLLIDPFYSDIVEQRQGIKRLMEPPIPIADLCPDLIFITHNHLDHFDPIALPVIHQTFPRALLIGPESVMQKAREHGFDEQVLVPLAASALYSSGAFSLQAVPAYHGDPLAMGLVLRVDHKVIYYSGDTLLTNTLLADIRAVCPEPIDAVFIIINGRLGNMTLTEAVQVVSELKPRISIPMHYGMFAENTADPHEFEQACRDKGLMVHIPVSGCPFEL